MSSDKKVSATMNSAATNRASAVGRRWIPALAGLGIVVVAVAACGSAGSTATVTGTSAATPAAQGSSSPSAGSGAGTAAFPGVIGTAAAVSASSMEVQNPTSGQVTVTFTASTPITDTVAATARDVTVGSCVSVVGKPAAAGSASGPVTATTVTISAAVGGKCTGGFGGGFGGGGFGGGGFGRGTASPNPSFSPRARPTGSRGAFGNGAFGGANGKVTSVTATGFVVLQTRGRFGGAAGATGATGATPSTTSVTVIANASTTYTETVSAKPSALKVGQCITALGTANSIGAIAAKSIRVSPPGPSGCTTSFAGRGGFGRPTTNA
jgi:Domain of unknown function (DUF5666)